MPPSENPIVIAATIIGYVLALPLAALLIRGIFFFGRTSKRFDDLVGSVEQIQRWVTEKDAESQANGWSFAVIEEDINELQDRAGIQPRPYPDRRRGPPDRRSA